MVHYTQEQWNTKKVELMEKCFDGFAELGLHGIGIRTPAKHCGYNTSMIYTYFKIPVRQTRDLPVVSMFLTSIFLQIRGHPRPLIFGYILPLPGGFGTLTR